LSYQVLARKWRPRDFDSLVGQQHVVRALSNGLDQGRLHHAFLFTGTRGVGKTTIARILAKALNCERGVSATPCGECEHCVAIDEGRFVDLLEIDAASRTKVDDTREILDNVQYAPARGRYKVYLIDEVHMLSTHSFNALLKTLEEPPEHVKFVLATTDPQKIPVTILSRCLQFNLRRLDAVEIANQLQRILEQEQLEFEPPALELLARAADGSMRDGLSLLDQALAAGSGQLARAPVEEMLGTVEQRHLENVLRALVEDDLEAALGAVAEAHALARDLGRLLDDLAMQLHRIALLQQVPGWRGEAGLAGPDHELLVGLADRLDPEDVQLYYQIAVTGRRDLGLAPSARCGCEMTLLRMFAFRPAAAGGAGAPGDGSRPTGSSEQTIEPRTSETATASAQPQSSAREASGLVSADQASAGSVAVERESTVVNDQPFTGSDFGPESWSEVLALLPLNGSVRAVAGNLQLVSRTGNRLVFGLAPEDRMLVTERFKASLKQALEQHTSQSWHLTFRTMDEPETLQTPARTAEAQRARRQAEAEAAIESDPVVRDLRANFDAEIVPGSIRPITNME